MKEKVIENIKVTYTARDGVIETANIIKLNKKTYIYESIPRNIGLRDSLVIDLNGYELIYTGTTNFVDSITGELYIIDTSENKTGKIITLKELDESKYNYQEKCDVNRDGVICSDDIQLVANAQGKTKAGADWAQYENCDINGDYGVNVDDFTPIYNCGVYNHVIEDYTNVYTDVGEGAFISQCIHNK